MRPRIIGIDASRAARLHRTGTETYALELIKALARRSSPTLRLRLYSPHPPQHRDWPGSTFVETRVIPWPRLWTHLRLATEMQRHPPDILFVPAHVIPLYCPVPALVTVHDLGYIHYPEAHRPFDRWYLNWTTRRHTRVAKHILADSQATKEDLIQVYGADPARITVVYLGRDESLQRVTDPARLAQVKKKYQLNQKNPGDETPVVSGPLSPDGEDYLLYLGTLHPRKNLVRLIEAFHLARQSLPEANQSLKLVIAGKKGWLFDEIFARVEALGLEKNVLFFGYVADEDKPALISGALAYVFPSLYEGFGLPVLEAMACGAPVLTSNVSSLPEVAGEAAILVDPHNVEDIAGGLVKLITDSALRQRLIERGYRQVEKFSWDRAAEQVLGILETALP